MENYVPTRAKIYLAGPFFDAIQISTQDFVEKLCEEAGHPYFSPRKELVLSPTATLEERQGVFKSNVKHVKNCRLVLANIEGRDQGTIWEMGAAFAYETRVVAYSPDPTRKMNVMLSEAIEGYLPGLQAVKEFLKPKPEAFISVHGTRLAEVNWEVAQKWQGNTF